MGRRRRKGRRRKGSSLRHLLGGKFVQISNSLIVGNLPGEQCFSSALSYAVVFIGPDEPKLGIMMTSFNQKRSKMDGTGVWHLSKCDIAEM